MTRSPSARATTPARVRRSGSAASSSCLFCSLCAPCLRASCCWSSGQSGHPRGDNRRHGDTANRGDTEVGARPTKTRSPLAARTRVRAHGSARSDGWELVRARGTKASSGAPPQPDEHAQGTSGPTARRAGAEPRYTLLRNVRVSGSAADAAETRGLGETRQTWMGSVCLPTCPREPPPSGARRVRPAPEAARLPRGAGTRKPSRSKLDSSSPSSRDQGL
jgi:hypothetical protein